MESEEIVVVRLEGLGTYAIPVAALDGYRVPSEAQAGAEAVRSATDAVPLILEQDFLRGSTNERVGLTVDRFGGVHHPAGGQVFKDAPALG